MNKTQFITSLLYSHNISSRSFEKFHNYWNSHLNPYIFWNKQTLRVLL